MRNKLIAVNRVCLPFDELSPYTYIQNLFFQGNMCNDRFDWLAKYSLLDWNPLNEASSFFAYKEQPLKDLIENRLAYVFEKAKNKQLIITWSGGVDSTFLSLLLVSNKSKDQEIVIYCTLDAIKESPQVLDFFSKANIKVVVTPRLKLFDTIENQKDYFCVSGQVSDQCFSFKALNAYPELFSMSWLDAVDKYVEFLGLTDYYKFQKHSKELIESHCSGFDLPIKTWAQFALFWNNRCKSTFTRLNHKLLSVDDYLRLNELPFFGTTDFLNWGLVHNLPRLVNHIADPKEYKKEFKAYIRKVLGNDSFDLKPKTSSPFFSLMVDRFRVKDTEGYKTYQASNNFEKYYVLLDHYRKDGF